MLLPGAVVSYFQTPSRLVPAVCKNVIIIPGPQTGEPGSKRPEGLDHGLVGRASGGTRIQTQLCLVPGP